MQQTNPLLGLPYLSICLVPVRYPSRVTFNRSFYDVVIVCPDKLSHLILLRNREYWLNVR